jgi:hypothetical protein
METRNRIFEITGDTAFTEAALSVFRYQYLHNPVYREFINAIPCNPETINSFSLIPCLPIGFFRKHNIITGDRDPEHVFLSSGTTGGEPSRHPVTDLALYRESLSRGFRYFYGPPEDYEFFALVPSPEKVPGSSLAYMISLWIRQSGSDRSGFFPDEFHALARLLQERRNNGRKKLLIGLTYALLDFAEQFPIDLEQDLVMETGGMKGKRKEMIREEVHAILKERFHTRHIHSEYGMTEMLSQAYSKGEGRFLPPPWMKIVIRDPNDPFSLLPCGKTGGVNILDLANINSCSFIATQDLGRLYENGEFEILGRFDDSDLRGCNLMIP